MGTNSSGYGTGFGKAVVAMALAMAAAALGHAGAATAGLPPLFFEGAAGGAVLGAFVYSIYRKLRSTSPLIDATSPDRVTFDEPVEAVVTAPPYSDREERVYALETNTDGGCPFKVWVADDSGKERHPYYATGVELSPDVFQADAEH